MFKCLVKFKSASAGLFNVGDVVPKDVADKIPSDKKYLIEEIEETKPEAIPEESEEKPKPKKGNKSK